jgi:hypothetical protein
MTLNIVVIIKAIWCMVRGVRNYSAWIGIGVRDPVMFVPSWGAAQTPTVSWGRGPFPRDAWYDGGGCS